MNRFAIVARGVVARALVTCLLAACSGVGVSALPSAAERTLEPSAASLASPSLTVRATPSARPAPMFPTTTFADVSLDAISPDTSADYQALLSEMAGAGGITATVMTPDGTWSSAAGTADGVHDVQAESQFGIASITKSIVAAQVMQLVEAGELTLDAPATDYLPADFTFDTNGATIRQLLSHQSGIPDWYDDDMEERVEADRSHAWTLAELLATVDPVRHPVDTAFEYADTNYNLLGLVIEQVRNRSLVEVLRDGVLRVEGIERLIYQPDEAPTDPMAMPLGESRDALKRGGGYLPSISDASSAGPAGAMASDSLSLARWWRAFCAGEVVTQASLTEMSTFIGAPDGYGLGLYNPGTEWGLHGVGHAGGSFGYSSWAGCLSRDDRSTVIVVLTNFWVDDMWKLPYPLISAALGG